MLYEKPWFKWVVSGVSLLSIFIVAGGFFFAREMKRMKREEKRAQIEAVNRAYEEQFRSTMVRVYQNLQLGHFLAAYRNLESFDAPNSSQPLLYREYNEALLRVAKGLLDNGFLDESERIFVQLQDTIDFEEQARAAVSQIASGRRLDSARRLLQQAIDLYDEKKYLASVNEFRKAKIEFDSVRLFGIHDTSEDMAKLAERFKYAKYEVYKVAAREFIRAANELLVKEMYNDVIPMMHRAAVAIGKAAYFFRDSPEIPKLRQQLFELEGELAYRVPNQIPIWNKFKEAQISEFSDFFVLEGYEFDVSQREDRVVKIGLQYQLGLQQNPFYVVRYRLYFSNGEAFFNGHYLETAAKEKELVFEQEIPEAFDGKWVKRIDLKIYNAENELVSRINRSFREPT